MLSPLQRKKLKAKAHGLKPVVWVGQEGLTPTVLAALNSALDSHELIKVKFVGFDDRNEKKDLALSLEEKLPSDLIGLTGHVGILYREKPKDLTPKTKKK